MMLSAKSLILGLGICGTCFLSSCSAPKEMYYWDNYTDASYNYFKKQRPEDTEKLLQTFQQIILKANRGQRGTVPPGIYAEYGYLLIQTGKQEEGIAMLHKEIESYPESKAFIERIIKQAQQ